MTPKHHYIIATVSLVVLAIILTVGNSSKQDAVALPYEFPEGVECEL